MISTGPDAQYGKPHTPTSPFHTSFFLTRRHHISMVMDPIRCLRERSRIIIPHLWNECNDLEWRVTGCCVCSGEWMQVENDSRAWNWIWQTTLEQLDTYYESLQLYIYTTCICSMSKVGRVSNHRVSKLCISASHRNIVKWSGQKGRLITVGDGNGMEKRSRKTNG